MSPSEPDDSPRRSPLKLIRPRQGPSWEIALYRVGEVVLGTLCATAVGWLASFIETRVMRDQEKAPDAQA